MMSDKNATVVATTRAASGRNTGIKYEAETKEFWYQMCVMFEKDKRVKYGNRMTTFLDHPDSGPSVSNVNKYRKKMSRYYKEFKAGKLTAGQGKRYRPLEHLDIETAFIRELQYRRVFELESSMKKKEMRQIAMRIAETLGKQDTFKASHCWLDSVLKRMKKQLPLEATTCPNDLDEEPCLAASTCSSLPERRADVMQYETMPRVTQESIDHAIDSIGVTGFDLPSLSCEEGGQYIQDMNRSIEHDALHGIWFNPDEEMGASVVSVELNNHIVEGDNNDDEAPFNRTDGHDTAVAPDMKHEMGSYDGSGDRVGQEAALALAIGVEHDDGVDHNMGLRKAVDPKNGSGGRPRWEAGDEDGTAPVAPPKRHSDDSKRQPAGRNTEIGANGASDDSHGKSSSGFSPRPSGAVHGQFIDQESSKQLQMPPAGSSGAVQGQIGDRVSSKEIQPAPASLYDAGLDLALTTAQPIELDQSRRAQGGESSNGGFRDGSANLSLCRDEEVADSESVAPPRSSIDGRQYVPGARHADIYSRFDRERYETHIQQSMENLGVVPDQPSSQNSTYFKGKLCLPTILLLGIIIAGAAVGIVFATRGGGNAPLTEEPTSSPTSMVPTSFPTNIPPSQSQRPSNSMSPTITLSPTNTPWVTQARFEGAGSSVQLTTDLLAFSNTTHILTYELVDNDWLQVGQALPGNAVRLSETNRIVVSDALIAKVYDLEGHEWSQVGQDIGGGRVRAECIAISGDGDTIAITSVVSNVRSVTEIYVYGGIRWTQYGLDISVALHTNDAIEEHVGTAFSFDGKLFAMSVDYSGLGFTEIYRAPTTTNLYWLSALAGSRILGGGPSVAMSHDAGRVVTGGYGILAVYDVTTFGDIVSLPAPHSQYLPQDPPSVTLTRDGTTFAYAWNATLQVVEIINDGWVTKGGDMEFPFRIDSLAFAADGRLAVGQPDALEILEHPDF